MCVCACEVSLKKKKKTKEKALKVVIIENCSGDFIPPTCFSFSKSMTSAFQVSAPERLQLFSTDFNAR